MSDLFPDTLTGVRTRRQANARNAEEAYQESLNPPDRSWLSWNDPADAARGVAAAGFDLGEFGGTIAYRATGALYDGIERITGWDPDPNNNMRRYEEALAQSSRESRARLAPDPVASSYLGEALFSFGRIGGNAAAGGPYGALRAGLTAGGMGVPLAHDLMAEGVDEDVAWRAGAIEGVSMAALVAAPVALPSRASTLLGRVSQRAVTGAAINTALGMGYRGAMSEYLLSEGYEEQASRYRVFDTQALLADIIMGSVFGGAFGGRARFDASAGEIARQALGLETAPPITGRGYSDYYEAALGLGAEAEPARRFAEAMSELERQANAPTAEDYLDRATEAYESGDLAAARAFALMADRLGEQEGAFLADQWAREGGQEVFEDSEALAQMMAIERGLTKPTLAQRDAAMAMQNERHARIQTAPGVALDLAADARHAESLRLAESQFAQGEDINVASLWDAHEGRGFAAQPARAEANVAEDAVLRVVEEMGLADIARDVERARAEVRRLGGSIEGDEALFSMRGETLERGRRAFSDARLNANENKIAEMARNNYTNAEIAEEMNLSVSRVVHTMTGIRRRFPDIELPMSRHGNRKGINNNTGEPVVTSQRLAERRAQLLAAGVPRHRVTARLAGQYNLTKANVRRRLWQHDKSAEPLRSDAPFYSAVERALETSTTARAPGSQWWATLSKTQGVKKEELQWLGLEDWLKAQEGPIAREDVLAFVRENGVRVEETVLGGDSVSPEVQRQLLPLIEERDRVQAAMMDGDNSAAIAAATQDPNVQAAYRAWQDARKANVDLLARALSDENAPAEALDAANRLEDQRRLELRAEARDLRSRLSERISELEGERRQTDTKWSQYTLPGGENYRELLLRLPERPSYETWLEAEKDAIRARGDATEEQIAAWERTGQAQIDWRNDNAKQFRSSHFDQPNILAHVRFNERTDSNGKRTLFIEEVQSDWHQAGRERGYGKTRTETQWEAFYETNGERIPVGYGETAAAARTASREWQGVEGIEIRVEQVSREVENIRGVPDAPFKNNAWAALAMKRAIRWAAENGFEQIAWTPGRVQIERFQLSNQVDELAYDPKNQSLVASKNGQPVFDQAATPDQLPGIVGKEVAERLLAAPMRRGAQYLTGLELDVGGEGMRAFYDRILPNIANDLGKKFGARVGEAAIPLPSYAAETSAYKPSDYRVEERDGGWIVTQDRSRAPGTPVFATKAEADARREKIVAQFNPVPETVHSLPITPEMREAAMEGQALFSQRGRDAPGAAADDLISLAEDRLGADWADLQRASLVNVHDTFAAIPADARVAFERMFAREAERAGLSGESARDYVGSRSARVTAFVHQGQAHFIADRISPEEFIGKVLHEIGVHHGLEAMVGARGMTEINRQLSRMWKEGHPIVMEAMNRAMSASGIDLLNKEGAAYTVELAAIADLVESRADLPFVTRILAAVRQWLVKTFGSTFGMRLTVDDVRQLAVTSLRRVAEQARREAGGMIAVEMAPPRMSNAPDGGSAGVERQSREVRLYRGVSPGRDAASAEGTSGGGLFMSPDRAVAEMYAGKGGNVIETTVRFENLLEAKNWLEAREMVGLGRSDPMSRLIEVARERGYDGITFNTTNGREYIQLNPQRPTAGTPEDPLTSQIGQNGENLVGGADARVRRDPLEAPDYQARVGRVQEALDGDDASGARGAARGQDSFAPVKDGDKPDPALAAQARLALSVSGVRIARIKDPLLGSLRVTVDSPNNLPARLRDALQENSDARIYNTGIDFDLVESGKNAADPTAPEGRRDGLYVRWTAVTDALHKSGVGSWMYRQLIDWAHRRGLTVYSDASISDKAWPMYSERLPEYGYDVEKLAATTRDSITKTHESVDDGPIWAIRQSYKEKPFDRAPIPIEDYQIDGPSLRERQERINAVREAEKAYQEASPVEQALKDDDPVMSMGPGRPVKAREALRLSEEAHQRARDMKRGYEAAIRCAIRHGGSMAGRSFVTLNAGGTGTMVGQALGAAAAIPAGIAASNVIAQNANPQRYAENRAEMARQSWVAASQRAAQRAGLDAPTNYEPSASRVTVGQNPPYLPAGPDRADEPPIVEQIDYDDPPYDNRDDNSHFNSPMARPPEPHPGEVPGLIRRNGQVVNNDLKVSIAPLSAPKDEPVDESRQLIQLFRPLVEGEE